MKPELPDYRFCPMCGTGVKKIHHEGRDRHVCPECGHVIYINPLPAATLVVLHDRSVLLTLRAVDIARQLPNVKKMQLLGAKVVSVQQVLISQVDMDM